MKHNNEATKKKTNTPSFFQENRDFNIAKAGIFFNAAVMMIAMGTLAVVNNIPTNIDPETTDRVNRGASIVLASSFIMLAFSGFFYAHKNQQNNQQDIEAGETSHLLASNNLSSG